MERDCLAHVFDNFVNGFPSRNDAIETNDVSGEVGARIFNHNRIFGPRFLLSMPACFMMLASVFRRVLHQKDDPER